MTTQNQANGQVYDLASCDIRRGSNRGGIATTAAKGDAAKRFSAATMARRQVAVEFVTGLKQTTGDCCRKESDGKARSISESEAFRNMGYVVGGVKVSHGYIQHGGGYYETGREILKQAADRFYHRSRLWEKAVCRLFSSGYCRHRIHVSNGLSEREAKFFLDRGKQSPYNALKFSGDFPARAKFHLHAGGKIVNCCSLFWGGADQPLAGQDSTRFREAETGRPNQVNESIPQLRSLRDDRPVGVISIPSAHGRRR